MLKRVMKSEMGAADDNTVDCETDRVMRSDMSAADDAEGWETEDEPNAAEYVEVEYATAGSSETQRRSRKRKRSNSTGEVRRSSRGHIPVNLGKDDSIWTNEEKSNLLKAIKKYGHLDMERLCEAVPEKSKYAIEAIIVKWWRRAAVLRQSEIDNKPAFDRRCREYRGLNKNYRKNRIRNKKKEQPMLAPIEEWIQHLRKAATPSAYAETKTLAKAMLYISLFEKHPDPSECGGVDFSALYDYLYRMLMGYPPKELNEATTKYILSVMDNLASKIKNGDFCSQMFHLKSVRKISVEPASVKQYGNSRKEEEQKPMLAEDAWMKSLLEIPGFNPLSTALSLLKID